MKKKKLKKIRERIEILNNKEFMYGLPFMFIVFYSLIKLLQFMSNEYHIYFFTGIMAVILLVLLPILYLLSIIWIYLLHINLRKRFLS